MKQPKFIRQPQYDLSDNPNVEAWELSECTADQDGWTSKRVAFAPKGTDPNKAGGDARAQ